MQYSQEHLKTMVYAEFGGQTECIMGNWKIENLNVKYSWTSLQRPPWRQKKLSIPERLEQEWMYGLSTKKKGRCREVTVVERWPLVEVWPYQELLALTKHYNEGDPLRRNAPAKGVKKLETPTLLGWFSNRTGT